MDIEKGIRFECQGSGNCCVSRGTYGFVYLSKKDIKKLSDGFKTTEPVSYTHLTLPTKACV